MMRPHPNTATNGERPPRLKGTCGWLWNMDKINEHVSPTGNIGTFQLATSLREEKGGQSPFSFWIGVLTLHWQALSRNAQGTFQVKATGLSKRKHSNLGSLGYHHHGPPTIWSKRFFGVSNSLHCNLHVAPTLSTWELLSWGILATTSGTGPDLLESPFLVNRVFWCCYSYYTSKWQLQAVFLRHVRGSMLFRQMLLRCQQPWL